MSECGEKILSEEYADFIGRYSVSREEIEGQFGENCPQFINDRYLSLYAPLDSILEVNVENYSYSSIPKIYGLMDSTAVEAIGSVHLQNQTGFELTGKNVIIGFIDTGIDYTNSLFKDLAGRTRILGIWDQGDSSGNSPRGIGYGSEYTREDINRALVSDNPAAIVPQRDENGHGTFMAGIACGGYDEENEFTGAAPDSMIAMVKLKQAKKYLRDYFFIPDNQPAFQENDIMLGVTYLRNLQREYNMPMVIVIGVGCGNGGREGLSPLSTILNDVGNIIGNCVVIAAGNEGDKGLHYSGRVVDGQPENVEIKVGEDNQGFVLELWGRVPEIFSIGFISPLGENIARIPARKNVNETINFLLDGTTIEVGYNIVESGSGSELIFMRFVKPSPGIWTIRVYGANTINGCFDIWANLRQFVENETYFLKPDPDRTIVTPGATYNAITSGGYNNVNDSIYAASSRGFAADGRVKPEVVTPSINVFGPNLSQNYGRKTGTSVGVSLLAGCCGQMLEWGVVKNNEPYMKTNYVKSYLIRGAMRERDISYPSPLWGYGMLDIYESFLILTRV